ncbi:hypothetical protein Tco_0855656 [Tanacetum coccineum]
MIDCEVKGVTTRGGKTTTQDVQDNNTNVQREEALVVDLDKMVGSNEVLTKNQPPKINESDVQLSSKVQTPPISFPKRLRKEKEEAQQKKFLETLKQIHINLPFIEALAQMPKYAKFLKGLLKNKSKLEEACMVTMNERCSAILLNKLPSKEKDSMSIRRIDPENTSYSEKKPKLEKISEEEKSSLLQVLEKLKEAEDLAADHLSRFESPHMEVLTMKESADEFLDEHLMLLKSKFKDDEPWYADFINYIVRKVVPPNWTFKKRKRFFSQVKTYFWEEPYAFKLYADDIMRRCVAGSATLKILALCHSGATGGHHSANVTAKKLNELAKLKDGAYENTRIYKEQIKKWHDSKLHGDKDFKVGNKVLLYNSRLKMYPGKLKSKWSSPNIVKTVYPHGAIEITDKDGVSFKVNGQRLKRYYGGNIDEEDDEVIEFENYVT